MSWIIQAEWSIYVNKLGHHWFRERLVCHLAPSHYLTNAGLKLIGLSKTHFNENLIKIQISSLKKMHLKLPSAKWWPFCLWLSVLTKPLSKINYTSLNSSSATYMRQWIEATLVQIRACRLFDAKPLSNNCWVIVNWTFRNKLQWNINQNMKVFIHENASEIVACEMVAILSWGRRVKLKGPLVPCLHVLTPLH